MADDFARLVSRTNPAARQYQPPADDAGYPPPTSGSRRYQDAGMDPFFHDDDDAESPMPDSSRFRPAPLVSQDSNIGLARNAQPMAGNSNPSLGAPQGWSFDDDPSGQPFAGSDRFNGLPTHTETPKPVKKPREPFKWWWKREKVYVGERKVQLNNHSANVNEGFMSNYVSTTKYNLATFLPMFFFGQW